MQVRRDPEAIPAASTGDNQAETGRRTNIASGTGIGGRSPVPTDTPTLLELFIQTLKVEQSTTSHA